MGRDGVRGLGEGGDGYLIHSRGLFFWMYACFDGRLKFNENVNLLAAHIHRCCRYLGCTLAY